MQIETNKFTVKQLALKLMKLKKITEEQLVAYFQALEQYYIAKAQTVYKGPYKHFEQTLARYSQLAVNYYKHAQLEVQGTFVNYRYTTYSQLIQFPPIEDVTDYVGAYQEFVDNAKVQLKTLAEEQLQ